MTAEARLQYRHRFTEGKRHHGKYNGFFRKAIRFARCHMQPGEVKFMYHLSDDKTHDLSFVHQVLEDIFRWEVSLRNCCDKE